MVMPEIGYLISSHYNVVLLLLSMHQSLTFLPLRTEPIPPAARRNIAIGFVNNNHFIEVGYFSVNVLSCAIYSDINEVLLYTNIPKQWSFSTSGSVEMAREMISNY